MSDADRLGVNQPAKTVGSEIAVTLHYEEWVRLLRLLDESARYRAVRFPAAEASALASAIRRQCVAALRGAD